MASESDFKENFGCGVAIVMVAALVFYAGKTLYELDRDLDSLTERAQVAASAPDMLAYMQQLEANMRKHNATSGHMAFVFKTPRTDLALQHQGVVRIIERLKELERLPHDSEAYQSGLDDLRGVLREMPKVSFGVWTVQRWGGLKDLSDARDGRVKQAPATQVPAKPTPTFKGADRAALPNADGTVFVLPPATPDAVAKVSEEWRFRDGTLRSWDGREWKEVVEWERGDDGKPRRKVPTPLP